ncbi:S9 family peptidase [Bacillus pinisoli]|uniref:S9 family peptidase n=1 Tax=Bacillus pinisoli TaxID=2901866 RepID=UPI001FF0F388|nr:S9 family peptidase [Bacillus pinisoli]
MSEKRGIQSTDLYKLKSVNNPLFSPSGEQIVFVQTETNEEEHKYYSHLFVGDQNGNNIKQFTYGKVRDTQPLWSPDGETIAFLSSRAEKNELFLMDVKGGEPRQLTKSPNGISQFKWAPDGRNIFVALSLGENGLEEQPKEDKKLLEPLVVEKLFYKSDASGFLDQKHTHIAQVQIDSGELTVLTKGHYDFTLGAVSPDGNEVAIFANPSAEADYELISDLYIYNIKEKRMDKVTSGGSFSQASWSPNGEILSFIGHEQEFQSATLSKIWLYQAKTKEMTCLTRDWDVQIGDVAIGDFHSGSISRGLVWTEDSQGFYFLASDHGSTAVYYGDVEGLVYPVIHDEQHVYSFTVDVKTHRAVVAISTPTHPGDLFLVDMKNGEKKQLTFVNDEYLKNIELSSAEPITFNAEDGWEIHGWLMKPVGFKEGTKVPLVVEIHGGPHAMYANTYFHEFQVLAAKGYAVLFTNPRGSDGYGQSFVDAVRGDYGGKDYLDIMSAVDYVLSEYDFIDETRLGVTGGSYGGFMTNWIVGHTNRFKAAVTQRSISNWISFYGVSDIGYFFAEWEVLRGQSFDYDRLWDCSPLKYAGNIETPLLILHGEKDYRCPVEQAEQLYITLKHQKKTTKLVRFPEANHELSRSGNPNLRIHRLNHIAGWFDEYL